MYAKRCNYCLYQGALRFAEQTKRELEVTPDPTPYFPDGVRVTIRGDFVAWLAKLPTECHCDDD